MPKYKVLIGSVRHNNLVIEKDNSFELSEKQAKPLLNGNIVELVKEKSKPETKKVNEEKLKKKAKEKAKKEAKKKAEKKELEESIVEPSEDWTLKELIDMAKKCGIKQASEKWSKNTLVSAIKKAQEPKEKDD